MIDILIIDDENDIREMIAGLLQDEGYGTRTAGDSDTALTELTKLRPHLVFLDIWLQGSKLDGLQILDQIKELYTDLPVVMISGHGTIDTAVSALKKGAYDYIEKPFKADRLVITAERALETQRLKREIKDLKSQSKLKTELIGQSQAISLLKLAISKIAPTKTRVLVTGQQGVGKELVARLIHQASPRAAQAFVIFTTDKDEKTLQNIIEEAKGGTVYIDEITDLSRDAQTKLLRIITDQGDKSSFDVRIISASSKSLEEAIQMGQMREDLFHRLSIMPLSIPSLAERRDDIPELVNYFITQLAETSGVIPRKIGEDVIALLQAHHWPGNVRQLRNTIERLLIMAGGTEEQLVTIDLLPPEVLSSAPSLPSGQGGEVVMGMPLREAREIFERDYLLAQINRFGGNISKTAEFIGMERSALHRKLKSLGVNA